MPNGSCESASAADAGPEIFAGSKAPVRASPLGAEWRETWETCIMQRQPGYAEPKAVRPMNAEKSSGKFLLLALHRRGGNSFAAGEKTPCMHQG